jgi:hypothetical protein
MREAFRATAERGLRHFPAARIERPAKSAGAAVVVPRRHVGAPCWRAHRAPQTASIVSSPPPLPLAITGANTQGRQAFLTAARACALPISQARIERPAKLAARRCRRPRPHSDAGPLVRRCCAFCEWRRGTDKLSGPRYRGPVF